MLVQTDQGLRLQRGAVLKTDGLLEKVPARGHILDSAMSFRCSKRKCRAKVSVLRAAIQFTRWITGSSHFWVGRRKGVGRGEGSSGLHDSLDGKD